MSLQDLMNKETSDKQSVFGDDLVDFQNEFSQPKQDMGITEEPVDVPDEIPTFDEQEEPEKPKVTAKGRHLTAEFVAKMTDSMCAHTLQFVAKADSSEPYSRMDDGMMEDFINAVNYYCEKAGGEIPPSIMIIICLVMMYGTQIPGALKERKLNIEREKLAEREAALTARENAFEERVKQLDTTKTAE